LGRAAAAFGLHASRTLTPQHAEVLLASLSQTCLQIRQRLLVHP